MRSQSHPFKKEHFLRTRGRSAKKRPSDLDPNGPGWFTVGRPVFSIGAASSKSVAWLLSGNIVWLNERLGNVFIACSLFLSLSHFMRERFL